jgi:hypothetical protein
MFVESGSDVDGVSAGAGGVATDGVPTSSESTLATGESEGRGSGGAFTGDSPEGVCAMFGSEKFESCDMNYPLMYGAE